MITLSIKLITSSVYCCSTSQTSPSWSVFSYTYLQIAQQLCSSLRYMLLHYHLYTICSAPRKAIKTGKQQRRDVGKRKQGYADSELTLLVRHLELGGSSLETRTFLLCYSRTSSPLTFLQSLDWPGSELLLVCVTGWVCLISLSCASQHFGRGENQKANPLGGEAEKVTSKKATR